MLEFNFQTKEIEIGTLLRKKRKLKSLKLVFVAEQAGISKGFLSAIEKGNKVPTFVVLKNICDVMEINVHEFLYEVHQKAGIDKQCLQDNFIEMEKELEDLRAILYANPKPKKSATTQKEVLEKA